MKTKVEMLFEIYQEVCKEAEIEWTLEGWKFFDQVMVTDYERHCKAMGMIPSIKHFKSACIKIALEMKEQVR